MIVLGLMALLAPQMDPAVAATVRYDAVSCSMVKDGPKGQCNVALVPRGSAKIAAYVTSSEGKQRIIYFRDGAAKSTDAGGKLLVERSGDTAIIRVGPAEVYEFPDRILAGK